MRKEINLMFPTESINVTNMFSIEYNTTKVHNEELFEIQMIEEILKQEYYEDFINQNMADIAMGILFENDKFLEANLGISKKDEEEGYCTTDRTYIMNSAMDGIRLEFGVYEKETEENYKIYNYEEFIKKHGIEKKSKTLLTHRELEDSIGYSPIAEVAQYLSENFVENLSILKKEYDFDNSGIDFLDKEEVEENLGIFLKSKISDFKEKHDIKTEDEFWDKIYKENFSDGINYTNDEELKVKLTDNLNLVVESAGDTSTYEGVPDLSYVYFEEKGNNRTLTLKAEYQKEDNFYLDRAVVVNYQEVVSQIENNINLIKEYKEKIKNSTDFSFLNSVKQVTLGWLETNDVIANIPKKDIAGLIGNKDLFIEAMEQDRARNIVKDEKIRESNKKVLTEEDFKVSDIEVFLKRKTFTEEDTQKIYRSQMNLLSVNKSISSDGELFKDNERMKKEKAIKPRKLK